MTQKTTKKLLTALRGLALEPRPVQTLHRVKVFWCFLSSCRRGVLDTTTDCVLIVSLFLFAGHAFADPVPYLRVETGMHGSAINRTILLPDGKTIATVSDDKTARLWSADTLKPTGVVRPPLGPSDDGALYAVAASGNVLAVGGRVRDGARLYKVMFYRLPDLKPIGQLPQLAAPVSALKFSRDGHTLVVGLVGSMGLGFYDLRSGAVDHPDASYVGEVQWIDTDAGGRTVVSGEDGKIRLYAADHHRVSIASLPGGDRPFAVAFAPDGRFIAAGSQTTARVDLLDGALHPVRALTGTAGRTGGFGVVAFAPDGQRLFAGGTYKIGEIGTRLARWWSLDGKASGEFEGGSDTITGLVLAGDGLVISDGEPLLARLDGAGRPSALQRSRSIDFRDARTTGFGVSEDGSMIELPSTDGKARLFDVRNRAIVELAQLGAAAPTLHQPVEQDGPMVASGWHNSAKPLLNNRPVRLETDERSLTVAASEAAGGAAFGTNFFLHLERADGREWHVVVPAPAYAVNISGDGRWVVAGLGDGTLRWYNAGTGVEVLDLFVAPATRHWVLSTPDGFFDHDDTVGGAADGRDLIGYSFNDPGGQVARFVEIGQLYPRFYRPDLVGLALRQDPPAQQVVQHAEQRQPPVAQVLNQGLPPTLALGDVCGRPSTVKSSGCPAARSFDVANPPDHAGAMLATTANTLMVRYRLTDASGTLPADRLGGAQIIRNAATVAPPVFTVEQDDHSRTDEVAIPLGDGANTIQLRPITAAGDVQGSTAAGVAFTVWRGTPPEKGPTPPIRHTTLYLLSVGISAYAKAELALENAASDARAVARLMQNPDPPVYDLVKPTLLQDQQATVARVTDALRSIANDAGPDDLVMIFFAGHGEDVDGHYYFAPADLGTANPGLFQQALQDGGPAMDQLFRTEGLGPETLLPLIQAIKASHVAIVLDTCYSGSLATQDIVSQRNVNTTVTNGLGNAVGRFVLSSATTLALDSGGVTTPGEDGHGLFTSHLLAALQGQADLLHTGKIDVVQLANYTITNVVRATSGLAQKQLPTFYFSGSDFFALRTD